MDNVTTNIKGLTRPQLQDLPDELILKIFGFVKQKDLLHLAQVSSRTSVISKDSSLWKSVRVSFVKKVTTSFLQQVIDRKCMYLDLESAKMEGTLNLKGHSELKVLDISNCEANDGVLEELIGSCHSLEQIGTMKLTITSVMLRNICEQNGRTLQLLSMNHCRGLPSNSIELIISNCITLTKLNLFDVEISENAVNDLINFLNPNIETLTFGFGDVVKDLHVEALVKRFKKIKHLGIKSCGISNLTVTHIAHHLKESLVRLHLEAEYIFCAKLHDLKSMQKLEYLACARLSYHGRRSEEMKRLRDLLTNACLCLKTIRLTLRFRRNQ
jgi:hypothetical protein